MLRLFLNELRVHTVTSMPIVFLVVFSMLCSGFTLYVGNLFATGQASLLPLFMYLPWLLMLLVPSQTMLSWSDDNRYGTLELLLTSPTEIWAMVVTKYLAALVTILIGLLSTFPLWLTISYLGNPDHGVIASSYLGALLLAAVYAAIGTFCSTLSRSATVTFLLSLAFSLLLTATGTRLVLGLLGDEVDLKPLAEFLSHLSLLNGYNQFVKGVISLSGIAYPLLILVGFLVLQTAILKRRR